MRFLTSPRVCAAALSALAALSLTSSTSAATLVSDDFNGLTAGASINGRTPSGGTVNGAKWVAPTTNLTADGAGAISANSANGNTTLLDLGAGTLSANPGLYTLKTDIFQPAGLNSDQSWIGLGFAQGVDVTRAVNTGQNLVDNGGAPWVLMRLNGAEIVFAGPKNNNTALSAAAGAVTRGVSHTFELRLDTSAPAWTIDAYLDGVQQDLNGAAAGNTYAYATNPTDTRYVGFGTGVNGTGATGSVDNFSLTGPAPIPEPTSAALLTAAATLFTVRRRRRQA